MGKILPESSNLDRAMMFFIFSGALPGLGFFDNFYVNQDNGIMSFNSSISLKKVVIDGVDQDAQVNSIGFLIAGQTRAILLQLNYLSIDGIHLFKELEKYMDSFRFTG